MKRSIPVFAIALAWAAAVYAAAPGTLTTLRAIHSLSNAEADRKLPVAFEATVTYYRGYEYNLFVQDDEVGIYVAAPPDAKLAPGDRVLIKGTTKGSFHPIVNSTSITVLRHVELPKPLPVTFDDLSGGGHDSELVSIHGIVRSANLVERANIPSITMQVLTDGGVVYVFVNSDDAKAAVDLLDAEVEVTGVAGGFFDGKMELVGIMLHASSLDAVKPLKRASDNPWSLPITPLDQILSSYHDKDLTRRIRVEGTLTYYVRGSFAVLQNADKSIRIMTRQTGPMTIGNRVVATGFADSRSGFLTLVDGQIQAGQNSAPIVPFPVTNSDLAASKHIYDLVSIGGRLVMQVREESQDEYVLLSDGALFSAVISHPNPRFDPPPPMKEIPLGSKMTITGICVVDDADPWADSVGFKIMMRSPADIAIVGGPSLLNIRNLVLVVGLLLALVAVVGARGWVLERRLRQKTAALASSVHAEAALQSWSAQQERQRSQILEDINGSRPLGEILDQIAAMVSSISDGAQCWFELPDGTKYGSFPESPAGQPAAFVSLRGRSGPVLGAFFVALHSATAPDARQNTAIESATRLAVLAIETRRLYSDLRRRSEYDLLTEIPNRFAMDKRLDTLIQESQQNIGFFGLIYIDLDEFKSVNDRFGHHVGDLYLQAVSMRMRQCMRDGDMLARLGGDEFAVLVAIIDSRAGLDEVAIRLERCFEDPFIVEGHLLRGAASFGLAVYPEDGTTKDNLLNAADSRMYQAKTSKRKIDPETVRTISE
jgi:diguanylate cyclase (GGDEF)-like protein